MLSSRNPPLTNVDVAQLTPKEYLLQWQTVLREQRDCALILGLGALSIICIAPLVWTPLNGTLAWISNLINLALYGIGVKGCLVALHAIALTRIERALAFEIIDSARSPQSQLIELNKLPEFILPQKQIKSSLAMSRMVHSIQQEAQNLRFDSSTEVVQPYMDEAVENVFEIVNLQKVALRGGICATFIGLLIALKQMAFEQGMPALGQENVLGTLIHKFSTSLFIAFSGSAVGLQVALILGALLISLRAKQAALFREMMEAATQTLRLARNARNDGQAEIITELGIVHDMIRILSERLRDHGAQIEKGLEVTRERIDLQTNTIAQGLLQLEQAKHSYDHLINGVISQQKTFTAEIREIYRNLSLDRFREDLRDGIVHAGEAIAGTLTDTKEAINSQTNEMGAGVKMLAQTSEHMTQFLEELDKFQREYLAKAQAAQNTDPIRESHAILKLSLNQLRDSIERLTNVTTRLNASVNTPIWSRVLVRKRETR